VTIFGEESWKKGLRFNSPISEGGGRFISNGDFQGEANGGEEVFF